MVPSGPPVRRLRGSLGPRAAPPLHEAPWPGLRGLPPSLRRPSPPRVAGVLDVRRVGDVAGVLQGVVLWPRPVRDARWVGPPRRRARPRGRRGRREARRAAAEVVVVARRRRRQGPRLEDGGARAGPAAAAKQQQRQDVRAV